jgi:hypothetical protein
MAGALLGIAPDIGGSGHMRFTYGQHFQVEAARDLIVFPYRLNGQDFSGLFCSSYNRWDVGFLDFSLPAKYKKRLGDESYLAPSYLTPVGPDGGGLRSDYLSMRDQFVAYETAEDALANFNQGKSGTEKTTIFTRSKYVPVNKKFTFNLEADVAYDINKLIGYNQDFFLSFYGAINGISTKLSPIALSQKDQLLWSLYLRFEPVVALSNKFFIIGLAGYENWKSDKSWMIGQDPVTKREIAVSSPIDFRDIAYGLGCDWEMAARVGLHLRAKWMSHEDVNYHDNDWKTPVFSAEIKMWY